MPSTKLLGTITRQLHVRPPPTFKSCTHHHRRSVYKIASMPQYLEFFRISRDVQYALRHGEPIVALESANITCPRVVGALPHPDNADYASRVEKEIRAMGAVPATIMVLAGKVHVGIEDRNLYRDMLQRDAMKVTPRDLPYVLGMPGRRSGGVTVAAALTIASMVGIKVLATGAIGGVHRSATTLMDISSDVHELSRRNVAVVCSGPKVYLDAEGTIEYLETKGVPVATFGEGAMEVKLPAHYSREGEIQSPMVLKDAKEAARLIYSSHECGLEVGQLLCNPIPYEQSLNFLAVEKSVKRYFKERKKHSKKDKEVVESAVSTIRHSNQRGTIEAEKAILLHNARTAASVAVELAQMETAKDRTSKDWMETRINSDDIRNNAPRHDPRVHKREARQVYQPGKGYLQPINIIKGPPQEEQQTPTIRRSLSRDPRENYQNSAYPTSEYRSYQQPDRPATGMSRLFSEPTDWDVPGGYERPPQQSLQWSDESSREPQEAPVQGPLPPPVPRTTTVTEKGFTIRRGAFLQDLSAE